MKRISIGLSALLLFITSFSFAQATLVEKVAKTGDEIVIPYEKYVLPNGLTIIVHEDHSDPLCHVDVTYHVGSAREEISKSGFAHFFEHMMFQGSDNVADEQHFKIITEAGGTLNGSTNRDRTNYFETVPNNQLEKMLWLEADRMGFLLNAVTQKKFEVQRATVKNERGQNYDNRPYGLVGETMAKNLYPYGHPYSWLTIGYIEDLNRVDVQDLKNFFLRWYGPNNATVTVGGDVNTKDVVALITKYFGSIPQCPKVEKTVYPAAVVKTDRYVSMKDDYAKTPMLSIAIPTVAARHKDEIALDCLAAILGGDNNSILYQKLVKTKKAIAASCSHPTDELAGNLSFSLRPAPGSTLADMNKAVQEAITEFNTRGVKTEDIEKFKASREAELIYGLESVSGKVSQLASNQTFTGNPNYIKTIIKENEALTKEDVLRVYNQYVAGKGKVILSVLTKDTTIQKAASDNYVVNEVGYKAPNYGYKGLTYTKAKDTFDRSKMPVEGANPKINIPNIIRTTVETVDVNAVPSNEIPVVVYLLNFKGGRLIEQTDLSKVGLTNLFAMMMDEDTKKHSAEELSVMLDKLGSSIDFSTDMDAISVTIRTLKKNIAATLSILEEKLLQPNFKQETFDRIKSQLIEAVKNSKIQSSNVATMAYNRLLFGNKNILGYTTMGTVEALNNITLKDVENYYATYFTKDNARLVSIGNMGKKDVIGVAQIINKLPSLKFELPTLPVMENNKVDNKTIYLINIPKGAQTEFRIGNLTGMKYDATGEYYQCGLMNYPLGGAFNSRLNLNLREDKGYTYGARSNFSSSKYVGSYTFSSGIKADVTDKALIEIEKEIKNYNQAGITPEELSFLQNAIGQSDARKYETLFQKAGFVSNMQYNNLNEAYITIQNEKLNNLTKLEVDKLAQKFIKYDDMKIVLAGDKDKIEPGLKALGYTIVELDADGEIKK
jgi:zinc protease